MGSGSLKQRRQVAFAVGKTVGELEAVVRLHTFHLDFTARTPPCQLLQEIRR